MITGCGNDKDKFQCEAYLYPHPLPPDYFRFRRTFHNSRIKIWAP